MKNLWIQEEVQKAWSSWSSSECSSDEAFTFNGPGERPLPTVVEGKKEERSEFREDSGGGMRQVYEHGEKERLLRRLWPLLSAERIWRLILRGAKGTSMKNLWTVATVENEARGSLEGGWKCCLDLKKYSKLVGVSFEVYEDQAMNI